jgi:hypothetical protein
MSIGDLANTLEKLSLEMNNQILLMTTINDENEIRIMKYQENSLWGMKVMLNADIYSKKEYLFNTLLDNYRINQDYNLNNAKVFDLGSDLLRVYSLIKEITTNILNIPSDTKFNFIFEKKRLVRLRLK